MAHSVQNNYCRTVKWQNKYYSGDSNILTPMKLEQYSECSVCVSGYVSLSPSINWFWWLMLYTMSYTSVVQWAALVVQRAASVIQQAASFAAQDDKNMWLFSVIFSN